MVVRRERKSPLKISILGLVCLVPLCSMWLNMPQALTLLTLGIFCLLGSGIVKRLLREQGAVEGMQPSGIVEVSIDELEKQASHIDLDAVDTTKQRSVITNAFSIDLEDYFHTEVAHKVVRQDAWDSMPSHIERSTMDLLGILDRTGTLATIFVLGWVAKKYPHLIRHIQDCGHEIACHSHLHKRVSTLTPKEFLEDTLSARNAIQDAGGRRVQGYRAPSFSIIEGAEWAFDILAELGFTYDSSVYPVYHPTYGNPNARRFPYYVADCKLLEIPVATWRAWGKNLPVGGGAYFRIFPESYIHAGLRAINNIDREPAMFYIHPWEIDASQPRLKLNAFSQFRQTTGLSTMAFKLETLLKEHKFAPVEQVYASLIPQWHAGLLKSEPASDSIKVNV